MTQISAVIITHNEERNIERCLTSLQNVADEIIVVDSFSNDHTVEICRKHGAKVTQHAFEGYIEQKNYALTHTSHDWVLSLDADEVLSDELKQSIHEIKNNLIADGYYMNRLTNYCGQWIRHSGWYPDKKLRLFDKRKTAWGGVNPHDKIIIKGTHQTHFLKGDLLHYSYRVVEEHLMQTDKFTTISAQQLFNSGKKPSPIKLYVSPAIKFVQTFFLKLGFLDGKYGFIICKIAAHSVYLKNYKLKQLYKE